MSLSISDTDVHIVSSKRWLLRTCDFCKWPDMIDVLFSRSRYLELSMKLSHAPLFIKTKQTILFIYLFIVHGHMLWWHIGAREQLAGMGFLRLP